MKDSAPWSEKVSLIVRYRFYQLMNELEVGVLMVLFSQTETSLATGHCL